MNTTTGDSIPQLAVHTAPKKDDSTKTWSFLESHESKPPINNLPCSFPTVEHNALGVSTFHHSKGGESEGEKQAFEEGQQRVRAPNSRMECDAVDRRSSSDVVQPGNKQMSPLDGPCSKNSQCASETAQTASMG